MFIPQTKCEYFRWQRSIYHRLPSAVPVTRRKLIKWPTRPRRLEGAMLTFLIWAKTQRPPQVQTYTQAPAHKHTGRH